MVALSYLHALYDMEQFLDKLRRRKSSKVTNADITLRHDWQAKFKPVPTPGVLNINISFGVLIRTTHEVARLSDNLLLVKACVADDESHTSDPAYHKVFSFSSYQIWMELR
ncbi:hypothetical protein Forpe1208_v007625 [Fusarium oxysporum f. sp. rapae]|uniref:Uncharacterized protein n=1 Tax=Fusarium oxysporum f. sp. rapae TaxID=485398 RepID=A0A8J5P7T3_FUSOX|nr:hypothetical protein Forpe1208_v007625 [Fusarium oxysporum f. sp. rapae]